MQRFAPLLDLGADVAFVEPRCPQAGLDVRDDKRLSGQVGQPLAGQVVRQRAHRQPVGERPVVHGCLAGESGQRPQRRLTCPAAKLVQRVQKLGGRCRRPRARSTGAHFHMPSDRGRPLAGANFDPSDSCPAMLSTGAYKTLRTSAIDADSVRYATFVAAWAVRTVSGQPGRVAGHLVEPVDSLSWIITCQPIPPGWRAGRSGSPPVAFFLVWRASCCSTA